jgi:hypothetical protein
MAHRSLLRNELCVFDAAVLHVLKTAAHHIA